MSNQVPPVRRSRVRQQAKRKRKDRILDILIGVVFVAILIVGWNILFGGGDSRKETASGNRDKPELFENKDDGQKKESAGNLEEGGENSKEKDGQFPHTGEADTNEAAEGNQERGEPSGAGDGLVEEPSSDPNVLQAVKNPNWQPIGTSQTGVHTTNYSDGSVDRREMERAMSYATGLAEEDMIVWWVGRGDIPNQQAVGTITSKDQTKIFRVYLEWVDGMGWKPTKVEYLKENDKKQS